jgi:hypothetical protein
MLDLYGKVTSVFNKINLHMKRIFRAMIIVFLLVTAPLLMMAQQPPHPNNGNTPGPGNGPVGGGAPVGGGLSILIAMGIAYGLSKYYVKKNGDSVNE